MNTKPSSLFVKMTMVSLVLALLLLAAMVAGLAMGSSGASLETIWTMLSSEGAGQSMEQAIIWRIRFPRVLLAALVGAALSLGAWFSRHC